MGAIVWIVVGGVISLAGGVALFQMRTAFVDTLGIGEPSEYKRVMYFDGWRLKRLLITDSELKRVFKRSG